MTKKDWEEHVEVILRWNKGSKEEVQEYRRGKNPKWYRKSTIYQVNEHLDTSTVPRTTSYVLKRQDKGVWKMVAHEGQVFDAIHTAHLRVGPKHYASRSQDVL